MLRRLVTLCLSIVFHALILTRDAILRALGRPVPPSGVILYYHSIPREYRDRFARQMQTMLKLAVPVRAEADFRGASGKRFAALTFDDGYQDVIDNALKALQDEHIPFTIFVVAGALGTGSNWRGGMSPKYEGLPLMSVETIRSLPSELVTIGSHTMTHARLTELNDAEAWTEIQTSRDRLEEILGREIRSLSFPYGSYNNKLVAMCFKAGYNRLFTTSPELAGARSDQSVQGRVSVEPSDWDLEFRLKVMGAYRWLPAAFETKRKLRHLLESGPFRRDKNSR